jgi:hypothetical protein
MFGGMEMVMGRFNAYSVGEHIVGFVTQRSRSMVAATLGWMIQSLRDRFEWRRRLQAFEVVGWWDETFPAGISGTACRGAGKLGAVTGGGAPLC